MNKCITAGNPMNRESNRKDETFGHYDRIQSGL
jgi:hypothetical protein